MLEDAFPGGKICVCYPFGHIVYVYENIPYDISGVSDSEAEMYIPIDFIGNAIDDFRHIPGVSYSISEEELKTIGKKWREQKNNV